MSRSSGVCLRLKEVWGKDFSVGTVSVFYMPLYFSTVFGWISSDCCSMYEFSECFQHWLATRRTSGLKISAPITLSWNYVLALHPSLPPPAVAFSCPRRPWWDVKVLDCLVPRGCAGLERMGRKVNGWVCRVSSGSSRHLTYLSCRSDSPIRFNSVYLWQQVTIKYNQLDEQKVPTRQAPRQE